MNYWTGAYTRVCIYRMYTQSYWVCGLCPSCGILNNRKTQRFWNWISFRVQVRVGKHLPCWVQLLRSALSKGSNRLDVSVPSPEDGNRSNFRNAVFSVRLGFWTMNKIHKPSDSECYTTSSEHFRCYRMYTIFLGCFTQLNSTPLPQTRSGK
jgi:hypothetical protein